MTKQARAEERRGAKMEWVLELFGPDGKLKAVRRFKNLITNAGLDAEKDRLFNTATVEAVFDYIAIGTDATPETALDVALLAETARGLATYVGGGVGVNTLSFLFAAGVGTGAITESGVFNDPAAGVCYSRKTFPVVNKGAGDTLKATVTYTVTPV